jgi:hypothetical protein
MTQEEYIKNRVEDQINWYGSKSSKCQKKYKIWQVIKIIAALLITTLSLWASPQVNLKEASDVTKDLTILNGGSIITMSHVIGALGAFIIFIESFVKIYDYKKLWVQYRMASENLIREKLMFETKSAPYNSEESFNLFVQRCESIMQNEMSGWKEIQAEEDNT